MVMQGMEQQWSEAQRLAFMTAMGNLSQEDPLDKTVIVIGTTNKLENLEPDARSPYIMSGVNKDTPDRGDTHDDVIYKTRLQAIKEGRNPNEAELARRIELARDAAQKRGEDPDVAEKQVREKVEESRAWWAKMFGKK
jgi:hypothetical protein